MHRAGSRKGHPYCSFPHDSRAPTSLERNCLAQTVSLLRDSVAQLERDLSKQKKIVLELQAAVVESQTQRAKYFELSIHQQRELIALKKEVTELRQKHLNEIYSKNQALSALTLQLEQEARDFERCKQELRRALWAGNELGPGCQGSASSNDHFAETIAKVLRETLQVCPTAVKRPRVKKKKDKEEETRSTAKKESDSRLKSRVESRHREVGRARQLQLDLARLRGRYMSLLKEGQPESELLGLVREIEQKTSQYVTAKPGPTCSD